MQIVKSILTNNPCYKAGRKISVKGLMLHSVGCPQPSARVFVQSWNGPNYNSACVHAFIDANTGVSPGPLVPFPRNKSQKYPQEFLVLQPRECPGTTGAGMAAVVQTIHISELRCASLP